MEEMTNLVLDMYNLWCQDIQKDISKEIGNTRLEFGRKFRAVLPKKREKRK